MFTFVYDLLLLFYYVNFFIKLFYVKETLCTIFIEEKFVVFPIVKTTFDVSFIKYIFNFI